MRKLETCMANSMYKFKSEIKQINETHQILNGWYSSKYTIGNDLSVMFFFCKMENFNANINAILIFCSCNLFNYFFFVVRYEFISFNT